MEVTKDGRLWRVGTPSDIAWLVNRPVGTTIATAMPLVFQAYATLLPPDEEVTEPAHEQAVIDVLVAHTAPQPWWLGYLDTGADDVVFPDVPRVALYFDWPYVLVEGGPAEALRWRRGHMRSGDGHLPDLFFPFDRSWLVTALWDDSWSCIGGRQTLIDALLREPLAGARSVEAGEDVAPPGAPID